MCEGQILLIRKKRGLGTGRINGTGGRIEEDETAMESAVQKLLGLMFAAHDLQREPVKTTEAVPLWTSLPAIPYPDMWQEDPRWLPTLIARQRFRVRFIFDGERLLSYPVEWIS